MSLILELALWLVEKPTIKYIYITLTVVFEQQHHNRFHQSNLAQEFGEEERSKGHLCQHAAKQRHTKHLTQKLVML